MRFVKIIEQESGAVLAERAGWCSSLWSRFRGLMLRQTLPQGEGIVLLPCGSVHMALMRFAIDVVYLDKDYVVVKLVRSLKPYQISFGGRRAHSAIELPQGTLAGLSLSVGDHIGYEPAQVPPVPIA